MYEDISQVCVEAIAPNTSLASHRTTSSVAFLLTYICAGPPQQDCDPGATPTPSTSTPSISAPMQVSM